MIELNPGTKTPLYEQLYAALADEIRTGQRAPGTPLPGRRTMAAQQGVSVNTVDAAYQMLAAEGLAEPRPRSGFYVQKTYGMLHSRTRRAGILIGKGESPEQAVKEVGMVVEGINALPAAMELAAKYNVEMPIVQTVNAIVKEGMSASDALRTLMDRNRKNEMPQGYENI